MSAKKLKRETIIENHDYITDKNWIFTLDDDKSYQFGVYIETIDMYEATGEKEYKQYPLVVSFSLIADKVHKSFDESGHKPNKFSLLWDCYSYMGGIPIDHILIHDTKESTEVGKPFEALASQFSVKEACIKTDKPTFGTIAAQYGQGHEIQWLQFKNYDAAEKYIQYVLKHRIHALGMMIGFILDRPINLMGESGWSVIEKQVRGCK